VCETELKSHISVFVQPTRLSEGQERSPLFSERIAGSDMVLLISIAGLGRGGGRGWLVLRRSPPLDRTLGFTPFLFCLLLQLVKFCLSCSLSFN
jgi:hypothetical protein